MGHEYLEGVDYLVEANSFERMCLYERHSDNWEDRPLGGPMIIVGSIDGHDCNDVCIALLKQQVNGKMICFWEATSVVVHHDMIKEWFKDNAPWLFPDGEPSKSTDAMNFHHAIY